MEIERVLPREEGLEITEDMVSIHSLNPFIANNSSPRAIMYSSHLSQIITLEHGEERIIQTGLEKQFGENTFSKKIENDSRVITIIKKYGGIDSNSVTTTTELVLIYEDLVTGEIDYLNLPKYFSLHQYFGFEYVWNEEVLSSLVKDTILPAGTILADSPTVTKNSGYKFGLNANVALITMPEVAEDGVVISESMAKKLSYKIYERREVEFGSNSFPLNLYGTVDEYKPFPEIGECINDDSVLIALREYDSGLAPALTSKKDVLTFDPMFDKAIYVKGPGGKVVDIIAYEDDKFKKSVYNGTADSVNKYVTGLEKYYRDIISVYEQHSREHYKKFGDNNVPISHKFNKLMLDAYAVANPDNKRIRKTYKNEIMDIYRLEFVIEYTVTPKVGGKLTDGHGAKGVIVSIMPDKDMPVDKYGNQAEIMMDPTSIASRMNVGRIYEQYFNGVSRKTKRMVTEMATKNCSDLTIEEIIDTMSNEETINIFNIVVNLLKILDTEQYYGYKELMDSNNITSIKDIIYEIITKELYLYYKISSDKRPYQIVQELRDTVYATDIDKIYFNKDGHIVEGKSDMLIAPLYIILLFKTGDEFLSAASAKTNHYNFPIGSGKNSKVELPWRNSPTKTLSETEGRVFTSYCGPLAIAEYKDRANSIETHKLGYKHILSADKPTDIDVLIDRNKHPYGSDASLQLINNIFNCAGIEIDYEN